MFPILQLGPLALQLPGLFLLAGVWISTWLVDREAPKHRVLASSLNNMVFYALISGILGARLWYALRYFDVYLEAPLSLFSLSPSTLAPFEGLGTGFLVAWIFGQRKGLPLLPTLDALTLPFAVMSIAIGFAHLASGDAFGTASELPWAIELWGTLRHPTQIYEILLGGLVFIAAWRWGRTRLPSGIVFFAWSAMASGSRLFLEAFRGDSVIVLELYRSAQIYSLLILLFSLYGIHYLLVRSAKPEQKKS